MQQVARTGGTPAKVSSSTHPVPWCFSLSLSPHCISALAWSIRVDTNLTRLLASMKETYEAARTAKGYAQEISTESLPPYLFVKVVQKMPRFKLVEE